MQGGILEKNVCYITIDDVTGLSTLWDKEAVEQQCLYLGDIYLIVQHMNATHGEFMQSESKQWDDGEWCVQMNFNSFFSLITL